MNTLLLGFCKPKGETENQALSFFARNILVTVSAIRVPEQFHLVNFSSLLWDCIFLFFMPRNFYWMLDIVHFAVLGVGYFVFLQIFLNFILGCSRMLPDPGLHLFGGAVHGWGGGSSLLHLLPRALELGGSPARWVDGGSILAPVGAPGTVPPVLCAVLVAA